jgi:hypothetical protein
MSITKAELQDFHQFAGERLERNGVHSLHELVSEWEAAREHQRSVAGIRESIADYEAGRTMSVDEAFAQVRQDLGLDT